MQNIKITFAFLLVAATNIFGMESELEKQFPSTDNVKDVCINIQPLSSKNYETLPKKEVELFSFKENEWCPRIYDVTIEDTLSIYYTRAYHRLYYLIGKCLRWF